MFLPGREGKLSSDEEEPPRSLPTDGWATGVILPMDAAVDSEGGLRESSLPQRRSCRPSMTCKERKAIPVPDLSSFESRNAGQPRWEIGRPQKAFLDVADRITWSVLDVGCGTGENALFFALGVRKSRASTSSPIRSNAPSRKQRSGA